MSLALPPKTMLMSMGQDAAEGPEYVCGPTVLVVSIDARGLCSHQRSRVCLWSVLQLKPRCCPWTELPLRVISL